MILGKRATIVIGLMIATMAILAPTLSQEEMDIVEEREYDEMEIERRAELMAHPLSMRDAQEIDLRGIPDIPEEVMTRILAWRRAGAIGSYEELVRIRGMKLEYLRTLRKYTTLEEGSSRQRIQARIRVRSVGDVRTWREYGPRFIQGQKSDIRSSLSIGTKEDPLTVRGELRMEKDAGESAWNDLTSGFVHIGLARLNCAVTMGTYRVGHGSGILFQQSRMARSSDPLFGTSGVYGGGIRPSASADPTVLHRGIAIQFANPNLKLEGFITTRPIHASIDSEGKISSFVAGDLFRTAKEQEKRNSAREFGYGARIASEVLPGWIISIMHASYRLNREVSPSAGTRMNGGTSIASAFDSSPLYVTGEIALDRSLKNSWSVGAAFPRDHPVQFAFWSRRYSPGFFTRYGGGAAFWSDASEDEKGNGAAVRVQLRESFRMIVSLDRAERDREGFAWKRSLRGFDLRGDLQTNVSKTAELRLVCTFREQEVIVNDGERKPFPEIATNRRVSMRWEVAGSVARRLRTSSRWEHVRSISGGQLGKGIGSLVHQEIRWKNGEDISVLGRVTLFDVDRYDARMFGVLPDLAGASALRVFDGKGTQWTLVVRALITDGLACSVKYAQTEAIPRYNGIGPVPRMERVVGAGLQIESAISPL